MAKAKLKAELEDSSRTNLYGMSGIATKTGVSRREVRYWSTGSAGIRKAEDKKRRMALLKTRQAYENHSSALNYILIGGHDDGIQKLMTIKMSRHEHVRRDGVRTVF